MQVPNCQTFCPPAYREPYPKSAGASERHRSLIEDPRVTAPFTEGQWSAIDMLGRHVDRELEEHDVRLTVGGEPTFVSMDDMEGAEWNYTALSDAKLELATQLLYRLRERFAPGGLLHFGQGKWYPGEPLPRWALSCFWRKDGIPLWEASTGD